MQEVFEKIIDKLEEERDQSYADFDKYVNEYSPYLDSEYDDFFHKGLERASRLVKQVAAEYNNGWIPCSDRLPEEPKENPIFEGKNLELYLVTTKYGSNEQDKVYPFRAFWNGVNFTDGCHILDVIAWQTLPDPYQPENN